VSEENLRGGVYVEVRGEDGVRVQSAREKAVEAAADVGRAPLSADRRSKSPHDAAADSRSAPKRAGSAGGGGEPPGKRPWVRGAFRFEPSGPGGRGLVASLALHGIARALAVTAAANGWGAAQVLSRAGAFSAVVVELPKVEMLPKPEPAPPVAAPVATQQEKAAPLGEVPGPVPKGKQSRKGNDKVDDGRRAGVLGMLGSIDARGARDKGTRGSTPGPDQQSPQPFAGMASLRDYAGEGIPVGGAGGTSAGGSGTDEGTGGVGGRGSGQARGLLNSYGDGTGDEIILERRGVADGAVGGTGTGSGDGEPGCRDETAIANVVESRKGSIRRCYNTALQRDPSLSGEISVRFVIGESGGVRSAQIVGQSVSDAELESCVLGELNRLKFEATPGCDTVVRYTFHLTRSL
jgi:hypothetical protein